jgi:hypothetical protein
MENYKAIHTNSETFEKSEIETKIPTDLVNEIKQTLDKLEGYLNTPILINPEDLSIVWGVMDTSSKLKFKVLIIPNN